MKNLVLISMAIAFTYVSYATEIVSERAASEVKTYMKQLTVRTMCEVNPGGSDREGGTYGPSCSCVKASLEIENAVRAAYPSATEVLFPAPAMLMQSLSDCGVKPLDVQGAVVYTAK